MSRYCTHYVDSGQEAYHIGNKQRDNSSSHISEHMNECGQEVEMNEPYCDEHTAMYTKSNGGYKPKGCPCCNAQVFCMECTTEV